MPDEHASETCPGCMGIGKAPEWGECLICAGHGSVHPDLAAILVRLPTEAEVSDDSEGDPEARLSEMIDTTGRHPVLLDDW